MIIKIKNIITYIICAIQVRLPPDLWAEGWKGAKIQQKQKAHKLIWELKKEGILYEDEFGILWLKK